MKAAMEHNYIDVRLLLRDIIPNIRQFLIPQKRFTYLVFKISSR
jgi:hypothetical protein